tara:strand:- start:210 stop:806 length:597 start_codon:yes stop_codon:yes gene_type:complete
MPIGQRVQDRPELVRDALIILNPTELRVSKFIGTSRNKQNRGAGIYDGAVAETGKIDVLGAEAELAFAKMCNIYPADFMVLQPKSKAKGTDDGDLTVDGINIDVKTTTHEKGMLLSTSKHTSGIDLFALIIKKGEDTFQLKGFMLADELATQGRFGRAGGKLRRPAYVAYQDELYSYGESVERLKYRDREKLKKGVDT